MWDTETGLLCGTLYIHWPLVKDTDTIHVVKCLAGSNGIVQCVSARRMSPTVLKLLNADMGGKKILERIAIMSKEFSRLVNGSDTPSNPSPFSAPFRFQNYVHTAFVVCA